MTSVPAAARTDAPTSGPVTLTINGPVGIVTINNPPVNVMSEAVWAGLTHVLDVAESDPSVRALVFQSALVKPVFTAGNDITALFAPRTSAERYQQFWRLQTVFLARLYRSPLLTVAVVRGQCPAGGTILALCCDYRVLASDCPATMGLNEVSLGIPVPLYWMRVMAATIGHRATESLITAGALVTGEQANKLGLVDAYVPTSALMSETESFIQSRLLFPDEGRQASKQSLRGQLSREWEAQWASEAQAGWKQLSDPKTVSALEAVLKRLAGGAKKQQPATNKPQPKL